MAAKANPESMKWPTDKPRYDKHYLRLYGKKCPVCMGKARGVPHNEGWITCPKCNGLGYVEKRWEELR